MRVLSFFFLCNQALAWRGHYFDSFFPSLFSIQRTELQYSLKPVSSDPMIKTKAIHSENQIW